MSAFGGFDFDVCNNNNKSCLGGDTLTVNMYEQRTMLCNVSVSVSVSSLHKFANFYSINLVLISLEYFCLFTQGSRQKNWYFLGLGLK